MFEDYASGLYSMQEIRDRAVQDGLTTKKGANVSKSQVEAILKNPFYYGYMLVIVITFYNYIILMTIRATSVASQTSVCVSLSGD